jgi:hypothetical protein
LVELAAVLVICALLAAAALTRFGSNTLENLGADGCARRLALDLIQAKRRTIATGDNHYLQLTIVASKVTEYSMVRRASGGDTVVDAICQIPAGVTVTASHATLEFNFDGASLAAYSVNVAGPRRSWAISTVMATGAVRTVETTL